MIKKWGCAFALFETTVGRLENIGHIIPAVRYFLSRIQHLKDKAKTKELCYVSVGTALVENLGLHLKFL
jgi:hypothetical protein